MIEQTKRRGGKVGESQGGKADKVVNDSITNESRESTIVGLHDTMSLERLSRQDSLKFLLRIKNELPDNVYMPKQFHYSIESVPMGS